MNFGELVGVCKREGGLNSGQKLYDSEIYNNVEK